MKTTEFSFINKIKNQFNELIPKDHIGIGDDCSVTPFNDTHHQITTTDLLLEKVHFIINKTSGFQLGYKSLMVNLSDIAAMGGNPLQAYLSLAIPKKINEEFTNEFLKGFHKGCKEHNIALLGGDTTSSKTDLMISVTAQGLVKKNNLKLRSGAEPGDLICVIAQLGDSAMGLDIILNNIKTSNNDYFLEKHNKPQAHIKEGAFLSSFPEVHAMIDISDGLGSDLKHICKQSKVGAKIFTEQLPLSQDYLRTCQLNKINPTNKALNGGEDYGLLFTVCKNRFKEINNLYKDKFKKDISVIGQTTKQLAIEYYADHKILDQNFSGFDHFSKAEEESTQTKKYKRVLSIAGSDSGGGAGIQTDIKTIHQLGGYPTTAITAITAQNTLGVQSLSPLSIQVISEQIKSVMDDIGTDTIKIGLLGNGEIIKAVSALLLKLQSKQKKEFKIILDPVITSTSGHLFIDNEAIQILITQLLPISHLITPNIPEAEALTNCKIKSKDDIQNVCKSLYQMGAKNILLKGGHLDEPLATDTLYQGDLDQFSFFTSDRVKTKNTHGTGCTLSSAIATHLAFGSSLNESIQLSKSFIQKSILEGAKYKLGQGFGPLNLNHFI